MKLVDEEMDGMARDHRKKLESIESELAEVRRWLDRLYRAIETTDLDISDIAPRIREHRERERKLQESAREVEAMVAGGTQGDAGQPGDYHGVRGRHEHVPERG